MIRACPFGEVGVSADVAWSYVTDTSKLDSWWDARLVSAEPAGPMAVGQHIEARANGLPGWRGRVVEAVMGGACERGAADGHARLLRALDPR